MAHWFDSTLTFLFKYPPRLFTRGDLSLAPVLPPAVVVVLIAGAVALMVYVHRGLQGVTARDRRLLVALRATVLALILACLLRPTLVLSSAVAQRNVLAVLLDDSRSMALDDGAGRPRVRAMLATFADTSSLIRRLSTKFAVRVFRFAATAAPLSAGGTLPALGGRTDIAAALDGARDAISGMPLAGMIVVTDGADNGGSDLGESLAALKSRRVPVFTVGVGEERFARDVAVASVAVPPSVLAGSALLLDAALGLRGARGERTVVTVEADGRVVTSEEVTLPSGRDLTRLRLRMPPLPAGTHGLTVRVRPLEGERVLENNAYHSTLDVRPGPARVLFVEGEPRPEFAFVRRALAPDSAVQVVGLVRTAEKKFLRLGVRDSLELLGGFPTRREELFQYRAVILGSLEASFFSAEQLRMLRDFVSVRGGMLLALGGRSALAEGGYAGTPVGEALPVELGQRADTGGPVTEVVVRPTTAGRQHAALRLREREAANAARWDSLPPLTLVNRLGPLRAGASTLLTGRDARGGETPVLVAHRYGRGATAIFTPQDSWLWRMHASVPVEDATHAALWQQMLRWLVSDAPDQISVIATPGRVTPGEPVVLRASVADSAFEPAMSGPVHARVTTPTGAFVDVPLQRSTREAGVFTGQFVPDVRGTYSVSVRAGTGGDTIRSADSGLLADDRGSDVAQAELRTPLLRQIASETGGRYYALADADRLEEDVQYTESGITQRDARDLWDMPVIFLLLTSLLATEWIYRRRVGLA